MSQKNSSKHVYIMKPVSAQARIKRDRNEQPLRLKSTPRITSDLCLEEVSLSLADVSTKFLNCSRIHKTTVN